MNGRVFDPTIGRFLSADPYIQYADNLQSYNRYSYLYNNPMNGTDPSGFFIKKLIAAAFAPVIDRDTFRAAVAVAAIWAAPQLFIGSSSWGATTFANAIGVSGAIGNGIVGGSILGFITTGTLEGAVMGGISGAAYGWAGLQGGQGFLDPTRLAAHAAAGCGTALIGGGGAEGCGRGAVAAVVSKAVTMGLEVHYEGKGIPFSVGFTASVVSGGTASVIMGGKFANGAESAAFGYLFNQLAEKQYKDQSLSMADRAAGLNPSRERTDSFEKAFSEARPAAAALLSKGSQVFIYGAAGVAFLPPPFDLPAIPLAGIGVIMDLASDILNPMPVKMSTDFFIDKAAKRLPGGAAATGAAQAVKDLKNLTPIGSN